MRVRKMKTLAPIIKALAVAALEDNERYLFLIRKDANAVERIELPAVVVPSGKSPVAEIKSEFTRQTSIDGQVEGIIAQSTYNSGSRKRRALVPVLIFKVTAKERFAKPSNEFSGFKWLSLEQAKKEKLTRNAEWLLRGWRSSSE
ncbi:MAG: hypothetical protein ACP5N9_06850 [Candidatus Bilamarchaeum sp.]|jgi:ADP-ribose pyrophosphatase YjhB (NUDIX family)